MKGDARHDTVLLEGTTDGSGDATVYSSGQAPLHGDVLSVLIDGIALTDSANLVLKEALTGAAGTEVLGPAIVDHADVGNAALLELCPTTVLTEADGTTRVSGSDDIPTLFALHGGRLKAVISAGGSAKAFRIWVTIKG